MWLKNLSLKQTLIGVISFWVIAICFAPYTKQRIDYLDLAGKTIDNCMKREADYKKKGRLPEPQMNREIAQTIKSLRDQGLPAIWDTRQGRYRKWIDFHSQSMIALKKCYEDNQLSRSDLPRSHPYRNQEVWNLHSKYWKHLR